jgi:hypothetical protein
MRHGSSSDTNGVEAGVECVEAAMSSRRRFAMALTAIAAALLAGRATIDGHQRYIDGVFVATPQGPVELIAYAEVVTGSRLRLAYGSMEDVPTLHPGCRVLVSLPAWRPVGGIVATDAIFDDPLAERRQVRWLVRSLNIYAADLEFRELAKEKELNRLLKGVKATDDKPAYLFIVVSNNLTASRQIAGMMRYYPLLIGTPAAGQSACNPGS